MHFSITLCVSFLQGPERQWHLDDTGVWDAVPARAAAAAGSPSSLLPARFHRLVLRQQRLFRRLSNQLSVQCGPQYNNTDATAGSATGSKRLLLLGTAATAANPTTTASCRCGSRSRQWWRFHSRHFGRCTFHVNVATSGCHGGSDRSEANSACSGNLNRASFLDSSW